VPRTVPTVLGQIHAGDTVVVAVQSRPIETRTAAVFLEDALCLCVRREVGTVAASISFARIFVACWLRGRLCGRCCGNRGRGGCRWFGWLLSNRSGRCGCGRCGHSCRCSGLHSWRRGSAVHWGSRGRFGIVFPVIPSAAGHDPDEKKQPDEANAARGRDSPALTLDEPSPQWKPIHQRAQASPSGSY